MDRIRCQDEISHLNGDGAATVVRLQRCGRFAPTIGNDGNLTVLVVICRVSNQLNSVVLFVGDHDLSLATPPRIEYAALRGVSKNHRDGSD